MVCIPKLPGDSPARGVRVNRRRLAGCGQGSSVHDNSPASSRVGPEARRRGGRSRPTWAGSGRSTCANPRVATRRAYKPRDEDTVEPGG